MKKMIFFVVLLFTMNAYTQTYYEMAIFDKKIYAYKDEERIVFKDKVKFTEFYIELIDTANHKILALCSLENEIIECPLKSRTYDYFKIHAMNKDGKSTWVSDSSK